VIGKRFCHWPRWDGWTEHEIYGKRSKHMLQTGVAFKLHDTVQHWVACSWFWLHAKQDIWGNAHETRESLWQFLFAGNLSLSSSISSQFTPLQLKIAKKSHKINIFSVQGHSRSSMLTFLRSSSSVLVTICSMSVPICNYLHAKQANSR